MYLHYEYFSVLSRTVSAQFVFVTLTDKDLNQVITKRCRLSWLTNSALVYERGCGASANANSCAHGAQINFGDLTPYLKGLSHEIDFKNVDENGQILALLRAADGF